MTKQKEILLEHYAICMIQVMLPPQFIQWLTGPKIAWRFMTAGIRKQDFFSEK